MLVRSAIIAAAFASAAHAQSTAFTYQGQLKAGAAAASGPHDMRFRLFDAATGGTQIGTTLCVDNVAVAAGLFTTTLDFGQQFATPAARFLEIEVRADTGLNCVITTGYTLLGSRQALTATPLASHAKSAFALDAADGSPTSAVFVDNVGKVGIGTTSPTHSVHIATVGPTLALQDTAAASQQAGYVSYRDNANIERAWVGYGTAGSTDFSIINARSGGDIVLQTLGGGGSVVLPTDSLGIGTAAPFSSLHVAKFGGLPAGGPAITLQDTGANSTQSGFLSFRNGTGTETGWIGYGTPGSPHMTMINARAGGDIFITPAPGRAVKVPVLEITGADLAEKFPASEKLEPGTVVAIDREHAGKLCMARGAYNHCVAGVVSGANNFSVGAVLGNLPGNESSPAIALSGRVYVRCDAAAGAIEPGDLLTTSDTPGHAMKATDRDRSHGTVIGKAMEPLEAGQRGLILVLVNLQ
jgi:hypothetical protein